MKGQASLIGLSALRRPMVTIEDFRTAARRRLPGVIFDFVDGGAGDEVTTRSNVAAFDEVTFRPMPLMDVRERSSATTVLGRELALPILLGPAGSTRMVHPDGELAVARAAARLGAGYALSTASNFSLEEVADAGRGATLWFQIYIWKGREMVADLVARAAAAGYHALCVTVDVPISGIKYRDLHNGMTMPPRITVRNAVDSARHTRWLRGFLAGPPLTFKNLEPYGFDMSGGSMALSTFMRDKLNNPGSTWEDLRWLRRLWDGPMVVKGILTAEAAARCFDAGADAVVCSNHGGRQLDGNPASLVALPEVVESAAERGKDVFIDGGVRRGTDVVKALALGAKACLLGRPYHWGLAVGGEQGVVDVVNIVRSEFDNVMAQVGCSTVSDLTSRAVDWARLSRLQLTTGQAP